MKTAKRKYNNEKVEYNGVEFDSKDERDYFIYLLDMKATGVIRTIELQPKVEIIPKFERDGKKYRATTYTPDYLITFATGEKLYIDVKGYSSQQGELRRKLFAYQNETPLHWVAKSKKYSESGWVSYDELQKLRRKNKLSKEV